MSLAYSGQSVDTLTSAQDDPAQRRKHLFDAYVDKMFARTARTENEPYSRSDTIRWLRWLAARMSEHGQTVFLIERMQPSWLQSHVQRRIFSVGICGCWLAVGLVGLVVGLLIGLGWLSWLWQMMCWLCAAGWWADYWSWLVGWLLGWYGY